MIELRTDSLEGISAPFLIGIFTPDQQIKPGPAEGAAGTGCSIADRAKASEPQTVWAGFTTLLGVVALAAGRIERRDARNGSHCHGCADCHSCRGDQRGGVRRKQCRQHARTRRRIRHGSRCNDRRLTAPVIETPCHEPIPPARPDWIPGRAINRDYPDIKVTNLSIYLICQLWAVAVGDIVGPAAIQGCCTEPRHALVRSARW